MRFYYKLKVFFTSWGKHFHRITFSLHFNLWTRTAKTQPTGQCSSFSPPRVSDPKCRSWDSLLIRSYWFHLWQPPSAADNQPAQRSDREAGFTQALCLQRDKTLSRAQGYYYISISHNGPAFPLVSGQKLLFVLRFDKICVYRFAFPHLSFLQFFCSWWPFRGGWGELKPAWNLA